MCSGDSIVFEMTFITTIKLKHASANHSHKSRVTYFIAFSLHILCLESRIIISTPCYEYDMLCIVCSDEIKHYRKYDMSSRWHTVAYRSIVELYVL